LGLYGELDLEFELYKDDVVDRLSPDSNSSAYNVERDIMYLLAIRDVNYH